MKRALSLILALVMVALMIPFSAFVTSATDGETGDTKTVTSPVELDETKYSPVYSVDFTRVDNRQELTDAGWVLMESAGVVPDSRYDEADSRTETYLNYSDNGLYYKTDKAINFTCGAVAFNSSDSYVIDYTFAYANAIRVFQMHFKVTNPDVYATSSASGNADRWCFRGDKGTMQWDNSTFREDATYGGSSLGNNLKGVDADAYTAVEVNRNDVRIRIFVIGGESKYAVMNVGEKEFYILDTANTVVDGSYFSFSSLDAYSGSASARRVLLKSFAIHKYGDSEPTAAEKACVSVDGVNRYFAAGTAIDMADYSSDAIAYKTNGNEVTAGTAINAVAENVYTPMNLTETKDYLSAKTITAGSPELRLASNPGIRYTTSFNAADWELINALTKLESPAIVTINMGTLITLKDYADALATAEKELTAENLAAYGTELGKNIYMDITADAAKLYAENTFAGSVVGVKAYDRSYVARAYITLTFSDATTVALYTNATAEISVAELAKVIVDADYAGYTDATEKAALDYLANFVSVAK